MRELFFQYFPNRHRGMGYACDLQQRPLRANYMYVTRNCQFFRHVKTTLHIYIEALFNEINITYLISYLIGLTNLIDELLIILIYLSQHN